MSSEAVQTSFLTRRVLAPNPGPMTLDGTNSYIIGAPDASAFTVVDPGPLDDEHLAQLASFGPIELILVTHKHADHTAGSSRLAALTGAPVRALDPAHCVGGGAPLRDGEQIKASGTTIGVLGTPGHTADSVCFSLKDDMLSGGALADDARPGSVLTGDTILGRGSTVVGHPDSTLGDYLTSLERLAQLGPALALPGHGPTLPDLAEACAQYRAHREQRLLEVRDALEALGIDASTALTAPWIERVTVIVYPALEAGLVPAATVAVRTQLEHLARRAESAEGGHSTTA